MANPEEIDNIELFPVAPRDATIREQEELEEADPIDPELLKKRERSLTPMKAMKTEFWHQGEQSTTQPEEAMPTSGNYAKRADQFGLMLLVLAVVLLVLVGITLYLNQKSYLYATSKLNDTNTASVDFYQGNYAYSAKVAEEKAAKQKGEHQFFGIAAVNDGLEVPLAEQMSSMSDTIKKMRDLQKKNELPPPPPDTGNQPNVPRVKPINDRHFISPTEFNKTLSKDLQTNH